MKKIVLLTLIFVLVLPVVLMAKVAYLSEEDYKKLKKQERLNYWTTLENEMTDLMQRKANAVASTEKDQVEIDKLKAEQAKIDGEYSVVRGEIMAKLGLTDDDSSMIDGKLNMFNNKFDGWNRLSDKELWKAKKAIAETVAEYNDFRDTKYGKSPDFLNTYLEIDNKIANLEANLEAARPKYYEDSYTVVKGDYLSKISGYNFIYNDTSKWPIIYRANRDQIKDPNVLTADQVIKIPRGLPNTWKVYKGEYLWKIASYPEVYGNGTKWPVIYRANKDQIKDPDLIYPNQVLEIPRD